MEFPPDDVQGWPRTPEKAGPPRRSGALLGGRVPTPGALPGPLTFPRAGSPTGRVVLLRLVSPRRERPPGLARRGGLGAHPARGSGCLRPNAPARRAEWVPVAGAVGGAPRWRSGPAHRSLFVSCPHVARLCVSLVRTLVLGGRYLVRMLESSFFSVVQNLPSVCFFPRLVIERGLAAQAVS